MKTKAYAYALDVVNKKVEAPIYVIKQCEEFIKIAEGKDEKYVINDKKVKQIESILKLLIMIKSV